MNEIPEVYKLAAIVVALLIVAIIEKGETESTE